MSHNWGYKSAAKMGKEMGFTSPKVAVKAHTRAPRVAIKSAPSVPQVQPVKLAKGGHPDAKQDATQIKGMVKPGCLKK
jgi:hypothetical protein